MQLEPRSDGDAVAHLHGARFRPIAWAAGAVGSSSLLLQIPLWDTDPLLVAFNALTAVAWVMTGILIEQGGYSARTAQAFTFSGICWSVSWSGGWGGAWPLVAAIGDAAFWVVAAYALLSHPSGRLQTTVERIYMSLFVGWSVLIDGYTVWMVLRADLLNVIENWSSWSSLDSLLPEPAPTVVSVAASLLGAGFIAVVAMRWASADSLGRRELWPFIVAAVTSAIAGGPMTWVTLSSAAVRPALLTTTLSVLSPPLAFGAVAVRRRLLLASVTETLLRRPERAEDVEVALRAAFRDADLQLCYWVDDRQTYVDTSGRAISAAAAESGDGGRVPISVLTSTGDPLALMRVRPSVAQKPELIRAVVHTSRIILENARLQASVLAELQTVKRAQNRILTLEKDDRRRLANDLHDGVQQRLIALLWELNLIRTRTSDGVTSAALGTVKEELLETLDELRNLAAGIDPTQAGLGPAVERLVERLPVPVHVDVTAEGSPAEAGTTAYYVICEGLNNAIKHAAADHITVHAHHDGDHLLVEVIDDGRGDADAHGRGLTALHDRVRAFGGTLDLVSVRDEGTVLTARLPCESP